MFVFVLPGSSLLFLASPLPEEGPLPKESAPLDNEAPEAVERRDGDDVIDSIERTDSN
jgi:hypothetical protein